MGDPRQDLGEWDVVAGNPLTITLNITSGGSGVDLTTYGTTWTADLRQSVSMSPAITFTIDSTGAASGTLVLSLTAATTLGMASAGVNPQTTWYFDLQASGGAVTPQTPFQGRVNVTYPYTHA